MSGAVLLVDWRDSPQLPRDGYYDRRPLGKIKEAIIHNTGGQEDVQQDNDYHRKEAVWVKGDPSVHAPHVAYHVWLPMDPLGFLEAHGIAHEGDVDSVVVWCNHLEEISWHATNGNPTSVGIATQGDGQAEEMTQAQLIGLHWLLNDHLPDQGVVIERQNVWGHGECGGVYGGGPPYGNATVCPGEKRLPQVQAIRNNS